MATPRRIRLGVIVPSSNTALEPLTQQLIESLNADPSLGLKITVHFARVRVTTITLSADANAQFSLQPMLEAACLLADAHVDIIGWSGTSASWLGFAADDVLCEAITDATGILATTAVRGMNLRLREPDSERLGFVTPYTPDVNAAIQANYVSIGYAIGDSCSSCAGLSDNVAFAELDEPILDGMVADVVLKGGAQTVLVMCTNVRAAQRAHYWEKLYARKGLRVLDSVATTVTGMLEVLGVSIKSESVVEQWGSVFASMGEYKATKK